MRISDWSSDVCSSDLDEARRCLLVLPAMLASHSFARVAPSAGWPIDFDALPPDWAQAAFTVGSGSTTAIAAVAGSTLMLLSFERIDTRSRSEEHTSELQSPMRISYPVFCLTKK